MLNQEFNFYLAHQKELTEKYNGKFLVIMRRQLGYGTFEYNYPHLVSIVVLKTYRFDIFFGTQEEQIQKNHNYPQHLLQ